ncbi:PQQ-binding-like beta-propeller repeat protein [Bdellovibrio sp.]|uniref:outer membrane protein assembly factor BamB family protein n=1 Tax=Bdellovibrio sp. TaxID=28201 RepID=UPI0039E42C22
MFGLMEITAQLDETTKLAIIPTVVLPFTILGMILTSIATWIAAFFGVELKAEGPKKLFEVLMKPKVLFWALLSNALVFGAIKGGEYLYNGSYPLWWVKIQNSRSQPSQQEYASSVPTQVGTRGKVSSLKMVWEQKINSPIFGLPIVGGTSLFMGTDSGRLVELDLETGARRRQFEIGQPVMASPVIWDNKIFVGEGVHLTHHARLYSFDLKEGVFLKAFETEGHIERAAVLAQQGDHAWLLAPAGKDGLYAVDARTMEKVWQFNEGHVDSYPLIEDGRVYIGTGLDMGYEEKATKAYALDVQTGQVLWQKNLPTSAWGVPSLWQDVVCFGVGDVYKNTHYGQLACYDKKTGKDYFTFNTSGALISQAVIRGDHLLIADLHGQIYQFNLRNKTLDWVLPVPTKGMNYASVVLDADGHVILPGAEGLYVYTRDEQKLLYKWQPEEGWKGAFTNVIIQGDLWILADRKGTVRALKPIKI